MGQRNEGNGVDIPHSKRRKLVAERAKAHLVAVEMAVREMTPGS